MAEEENENVRYSRFGRVLKKSLKKKEMEKVVSDKSEFQSKHRKSKEPVPSTSTASCSYECASSSSSTLSADETLEQLELLNQLQICDDFSPEVLYEVIDLDATEDDDNLQDNLQKNRKKKQSPETQKRGWKNVAKKRVQPVGKRFSRKKKAMRSEEPEEDSPEMNVPLGIAPIDVAAHLTLLGEGLTKIGEVVSKQENVGPGAYDALIDMVLCSVGPILRLTSQIPGLEDKNDEKFKKILDHVAYILPGMQ